MLKVRRSNERGHVDHGWLNTYHTFSFAHYYDPQFMGFRDLRVINEDVVAGGRGFGKHPHDNMEIITYVLEGELQHHDSMGNGSTIRPGDVQLMTAGTGVIHSEMNPSEKPVHLLQIWMMPDKEQLKPAYQQRNFPASDKQNRWRLLASKSGREDSLPYNQDADLYATLLDEGKSLTFEMRPGRGAWLQVIRGEVELNGEMLHAGDGVAVEDEKVLQTLAKTPAEMLLFDLS